jgi:hypothetical protein
MAGDPRNVRVCHVGGGTVKHTGGGSVTLAELADRTEACLFDSATLLALIDVTEAVLAHSRTKTVPHSPAWDDELEDVYKLAETVLAVVDAS